MKLYENMYDGSAAQTTEAGVGVQFLIYDGDETSGQRACTNGHLPTAHQR